ncbi:hypothetical protein [Hyalangium gracile]|uniref:hypothetical protein n=1 Tax=Hyalangium gracile TaxID=394092 RepID=UPI001CCAE246|nr:hypothetical protein [Hyalangium gracile]
MYRQKTLDHVRRIILDSRPGLHPSRVTEAASLTGDLDLTPSHLDSLMSRLQTEVTGEGRAFTPWFIRALRPGQDTVGSLVDFLLETTKATTASTRPGLKAA